MGLLSSKIKAGSLQFAILISVVIAIVVSAFILLSYTQLQFAKQIERSSNTLKLCATGIAYARQQPILYRDSLNVSLENNGLGEEVTVFKSHWGIYDKVIAIGKSKNFRSKKIALLGGRMSAKKRPALFLEDTNTPLVVVGSTKVTGTAIVPRQGVKAGNIAGNYYQGDKLIYGAIQNTASKKPTISEEKRAHVKRLLFGSVPEENTSSVFQNEIKHSFSEPTQWFYKPGVIDLSNQSIADNIIVKSDTLIRVSAFAKAKNILLIAPHIEIDKGVEGNFQAIASKRITVGENARLLYPSALILQESTNKIIHSEAIINVGIQISQGAEVQGSILHLSTTTENIRQPKISIAEGAIVKGELYSDEWVELLGTVYGSVYTHQLATRAKGSMYKNHLFNATINASLFPERYSGILMGTSTKSIVQWVY